MLETAPAYKMLDSVIATVARQASNHYQKHSGVHAVIYPFEDGRSQLVTVSHISSWSNRPVVLFYSIIGEFRPELDYRQLLASSLRSNYARLCLIQDKYLAVAASLDPVECERSRLLSAIEYRLREVALLADNMEQEYYGCDVF